METRAILEQDVQLIIEENRRLAEKINYADLEKSIFLIKSANRIFFMGTGRSGFALKCVAMRFMHFGLTVYVVGETNTPAIMKGDLLIAASGSGTTSSVLSAAEKARATGAAILAFSTNGQNPLARLASLTIIVPAAEKEDFSTKVSQQYAGSLFEQFLLLISDAIFKYLFDSEGKTKEMLWPRHANLE